MSLGAIDSGVVLRYSVLAHAVGGLEASGPIQDGGCNLSTDVSPAFENSLNDINPLLGTLADHGGPTRTIALQSGSPAIDLPGCTGAAPVDQRGLARDGRPDAGSFELDARLPQLSVASAAPGTIEVSWPDFGVTYTLEMSGSLPGDWTAVEGAMQQNGTWLYHPETLGNQGYYRLHQ